MPLGAFVERVWVLDTNVLISAALSPRGTTGRLVQHLLGHGPSDGHLWFSAQTFNEFESRLLRPKFEAYVSLQARREVLRSVAAAAYWHEVSDDLPVRHPSRDAADNMFLQLAEMLESGARVVWLVTGDADLLDLSQRYAAAGALRIATVAQALQALA